MKKTFSVTIIFLGILFSVNEIHAQGPQKILYVPMSPEIQEVVCSSQHIIKIPSCNDKIIFIASKNGGQVILVASKIFMAWIIIPNPSLKNETGYQMIIRDTLGGCDEIIVRFQKGKEVIPATYSLIENDWILRFPEERKRLFGESFEEIENVSPSTNPVVNPQTSPAQTAPDNFKSTAPD